MACWTLSKLFEDKDNPSPKIIKKMVELLKDSYWKVRTSACIALGTIIKEPNELVIQALVRALNDGSINKNTVC
jgi:HEAT repeat protein